MDHRTRPTVAVLHGTTRPPGMHGIEADATVRYCTAAGLADELPGAEVLLAWDFSTDAVVRAWPAAGSLRWIHAASAGVDHVLSAEVAASGVQVTNSRGIFDEPVAEYVLGLVLALAKDLPATLRLQARHRWQHRESQRLAGSSALVVGTGPIGRAIARKLTAVGVSVSGVGRTGRASDPDLGDVTAVADLHAVLPRHDWVILAAPLTPRTTGMIDAAALRAMRPTARLVNVGRGRLVVEADLVAALAAGELAGAALDVVAEEPLAESSPLWDLPTVLVSPHMSGDVAGWRDELVALFAANLGRYVEGRPLLNVVDKHLGYVREGAS